MTPTEPTAIPITSRRTGSPGAPSSWPLTWPSGWADRAPAKFYATAAPDVGQITTDVDGRAWFGQKLAAMRAHATQVTVSAPFFALSDGVRRRAFGTEYYTLLVRPHGPGARETDLFAASGQPISLLL